MMRMMFSSESKLSVPPTCERKRRKGTGDGHHSDVDEA